jgi:hypothetical protein
MTSGERVESCKRIYEKALRQSVQHPEEIRMFRHNYWRSKRDNGDPVCNEGDCLSEELRQCANRHWVCAQHRHTAEIVTPKE